MTDYVDQLEDLRNGELKNVHISRLNFHMDADLDSEAIMSHVLASKTAMLVQRLMKLDLEDEELKVKARWRCVPATKDAPGSLLQIHQDVPDLVQRL